MFQQNWSKSVIVFSGTVPWWDWQSWAKELFLPSSYLSSWRAIWEETKVLEILGNSERVRVWGEDWLQGSIFSSVFVSPLSLLILLPLLASTVSLPYCIQRHSSCSLWGCSRFMMQKFIPAQAKGTDGQWTFLWMIQRLEVWAPTPRCSPHLSRCLVLHLSWPAFPSIKVASMYVYFFYVVP